MPRVTVFPATASRFDDLELTLTGGGDGRSCQCQWYTMSSRSFEHSTLTERTELLRTESTQPVAPGLVAYVDDAAAGWVRIGPRSAQPRWARSHAARDHSPEPHDDARVWAMTCFSVRREFRGLGVMTALTAAGVDFARENGARVIEAYPIDTSVRTPTRDNDLFHGSLSVFERAGFAVVARPARDRAWVTLDVDGLSR